MQTDMSHRAPLSSGIKSIQKSLRVVSLSLLLTYLSRLIVIKQPQAVSGGGRGHDFHNMGGGLAVVANFLKLPMQCVKYQ